MERSGNFDIFDLYVVKRIVLDFDIDFRLVPNRKELSLMEETNKTGYVLTT